MADFNFHADPESARAILTAAATKTLVPTDVACEFVFTFDELNRLNFAKAGRLGEFFESLITYYLRAYHSRLGVESVPLAELVALAAVTHPNWFESEMRPVDIETQGELTRGMTVIDRRMRTQATAGVEVLTGFAEAELQHDIHRFFELR